MGTQFHMIVWEVVVNTRKTVVVGTEKILDLVLRAPIVTGKPTTDLDHAISLRVHWIFIANASMTVFGSSPWFSLSFHRSSLWFGSLCLYALEREGFQKKLSEEVEVSLQAASALRSEEESSEENLDRSDSSQDDGNEMDAPENGVALLPLGQSVD